MSRTFLRRLSKSALVATAAAIAAIAAATIALLYFLKTAWERISCAKKHLRRFEGMPRFGSKFRGRLRGIRSLRLESLERRELLNADPLFSAEVFASETETGQIDFEIVTYDNRKAVFDISAIRIGDDVRAGRIEIYDTRAKAYRVAGNDGRYALETGSYTIIVTAGRGALGNYACTVAMPTDGPTNSVDLPDDLRGFSRFAQMETGKNDPNDPMIRGARSYYAELGYSVAAGRSVYSTNTAKLDLDGSAHYDANDLALIDTMVDTGKISVYLKSFEALPVESPDTQGPSLTVGLDDGRKIGTVVYTVSPSFTGKATDAHGVVSLTATMGGKTIELALPAGKDGGFTVTSDQVFALTGGNAAGHYRITLEATDFFGNTTVVSHDFRIAAPPTVNPSLPAVITVAAAGTSGPLVLFTTNGPSAGIVEINGRSVPGNGTLDLSGIGNITIKGNTLVYAPDGRFDEIPRGDSARVNLLVTIRDELGNEVEKSLTFTVEGKNHAPAIKEIGDKTYSIGLKEGESTTVSLDRLTGFWTDHDNDVLRLADVGLEKIEVPEELEAFFNRAVLENAGTWKITPEGLVLDAGNTLFQTLGAGRSITLTFSYRMRDALDVLSSDTGLIVLTVDGIDTPGSLQAGAAEHGIDLTEQYGVPRWTVDPRLSYRDPDRNDLRFVCEIPEVTVYDAGGKAVAMSLPAGLFTLNADNRIEIDLSSPVLQSLRGDGAYTFECTITATADGSGAKTSTKVTFSILPLKTPGFNPESGGANQQTTVRENENAVLALLDDWNDFGGGKAGWTILGADGTVTTGTVPVATITGVDIGGTSTLPEWLDDAFVNGAFSFRRDDNGVMQLFFEPGDRWTGLNYGDRVTISFEYRVQNDRGIVSDETHSATIVVEGISPPRGKYGTPMANVSLRSGDRITIKPINSWTSPDGTIEKNKSSWSLVGVNGELSPTVALVSGPPGSGPPGSASGLAGWEDSLFFRVQNDIPQLEFRSETFFDGLAPGEQAVLEITYRVMDSDGNVSEECGSIMLTIFGTQPPSQSPSEPGVTTEMAAETANETPRIPTTVATAQAVNKVPSFSEAAINDRSVVRIRERGPDAMPGVSEKIAFDKEFDVEREHRKNAMEKAVDAAFLAAFPEHVGEEEPLSWASVYFEGDDSRANYSKANDSRANDSRANDFAGPDSGYLSGSRKIGPVRRVDDMDAAWAGLDDDFWAETC